MHEALILFPVAISTAVISGLVIYGILVETTGTPTPSTKPKAVTKLAVSTLAVRLARVLQGEVRDTREERARYSRDTSVFTRTPSVVVHPKDAQDVAALVTEIGAIAACGTKVSLTARAAGTDMSGGPLTDSVLAVFTTHLNKVHEVGDGYAIAEPGVFYRDFEKQTLAHDRQILPSYPASREIAALGGILNNNSGGERTLEYGKTEDYVEEVEVVLADGTITTFKELTKDELVKKKALSGLEGSIYRSLDELLSTHESAIKSARPKVSKNSAGYALWNIKDSERGTFNLAKLITGSQGTLAITTKMRLRLIKEQPNRSMLVAFLSEQDLPRLPEIVKAVLPHNPESFESFDEHTLSLALRFLPQLLLQMGIIRAIRLGFSFIPELRMALSGGLPKLILMAEFSEDSPGAACAAALAAERSISEFQLKTQVLKDERESERYWIVRRESFALLRKNSKGLYAAPFIDDFVVPVDSYPTFLPELNALLAEYSGRFIYTIAGHIGNGNFHIIPLMDLSKPEVRAVITELSPKVYALVMKYGGTTTGEHNDGIIRTPYLPQLFGDDIYALFKKTKHIFDPRGIFNPGKKVDGTFTDIERSLLKSVG